MRRISSWNKISSLVPEISTLIGKDSSFEDKIKAANAISDAISSSPGSNGTLQELITKDGVMAIVKLLNTPIPRGPADKRASAIAAVEAGLRLTYHVCHHNPSDDPLVSMVLMGIGERICNTILVNSVLEMSDGSKKKKLQLTAVSVLGMVAGRFPNDRGITRTWAKAAGGVEVFLGLMPHPSASRVVLFMCYNEANLRLFRAAGAVEYFSQLLSRPIKQTQTLECQFGLALLGQPVPVMGLTIGAFTASSITDDIIINNNSNSNIIIEEETQDASSPQSIASRSQSLINSLYDIPANILKYFSTLLSTEPALLRDPVPYEPGAFSRNTYNDVGQLTLWKTCMAVSFLCANESISAKLVNDGVIGMLSKVLALRWHPTHYMKFNGSRTVPQIELLWAAEHSLYALWQLAMCGGKEVSDTIAALDVFVVQLALDRAMGEAVETSNARLSHIVRGLKFVLDRVGVPEMSGVDDHVARTLFRTSPTETDILEDLPEIEGEVLPPLPSRPHSDSILTDDPQQLQPHVEEEASDVKVAVLCDTTKRKTARAIRDELWKTSAMKVGVWMPPLGEYSFDTMADALKAADAILICVCDEFKFSATRHTEALFLKGKQKTVFIVTLSSDLKFEDWVVALAMNRKVIPMPDASAAPDMTEMLAALHKVANPPPPPFDLAKWLWEMSMSQYEVQFRNEGFDSPFAFMGCTDDDLKALGVLKLGHRKAILNNLPKYDRE